MQVMARNHNTRGYQTTPDNNEVTKTTMSPVCRVYVVTSLMSDHRIHRLTNDVTAAVASLCDMWSPIQPKLLLPSVEAHCNGSTGNTRH